MLNLQAMPSPARASLSKPSRCGNWRSNWAMRAGLSQLAARRNPLQSGPGLNSISAISLPPNFNLQAALPFFAGEPFSRSRACGMACGLAARYGDSGTRSGLFYRSPQRKF
ncbi:MAG: hypothetical protein R3D58_16270 [Saprospiraceae bacterium]